MRRKHADLIKAWADGSEIQFLGIASGEWRDCKDNNPDWFENFEYRIKPEPKPDFILFTAVIKPKKPNQVIERGNIFKLEDVNYITYSTYQGCYDNLKLTFDGETDALKSAEVIK